MRHLLGARPRGVTASARDRQVSMLNCWSMLSMRQIRTCLMCAKAHLGFPRLWAGNLVPRPTRILSHSDVLSQTKLVKPKTHPCSAAGMPSSRLACGNNEQSHLGTLPVASPPPTSPRRRALDALVSREDTFRSNGHPVWAANARWPPLSQSSSGRGVSRSPIRYRSYSYCCLRRACANAGGTQQLWAVGAR
jgi:hypothetical protein